MDVQKVKHHRVYEEVVKQLENMIFEGNLSPGDLLPTERKLAEDFGISRSTLREAYRILEREGIVETKPGGGRYISHRLDDYRDWNQLFEEIETATIMDLLVAREVFETGIVERAARVATEEDVAAIKAALDEWGKDQSTEMKENSSDRNFHLTIAKATKNYVLVSFIDLQMDLIKKTIKKLGHLPNRRNEIYEEHKAIYQAIKNHDPEQAKSALLHHLGNVKSNLENKG
ncbi:FadR family transcriptional regulator [Salicibibacter cibarius]|uniref:FadR family transcriptional regulator n=1 Tax=Salicibibacter cibarius TaxID=2743000 RepID=A0A7T6Z6J4_9BACI|nr:FadR/GntR family transcriptional regulator [Salicibibacter cibarius]QQK77723.1 FadR family transcriptional regulator [Salicibibacter cibarius]